MAAQRDFTDSTRTALESCLRQLKCHFTWNLVERGQSLAEFEDEVCNPAQYQNHEFRATVFNLRAYIEHRRGRGEAALEHLRRAEALIQREHAEQAGTRSLVTWGNYAWVYYHLGRLADAQRYVDKVRRVCEKFRSPYRMESAELDFEEGWARLQCGGRHSERAKVCFEKALEKEPKNPEFASGLAVASYRLDTRPQPQNPVDPLRRAIRLNPDNQYAKVLLALKLQKLKEEGEGDRLVEEALKGAPCASDVLCGAAELYQRKGALDKAAELLTKALEGTPNDAYLHWNIGCLYRTKVFEMLQDVGKNETGKRERLQEAIGQAVHHLKRAEEAGVNLPCVFSYLACLYVQAGQYDDAEHYFQKEFSKELSPGARQVLHLRYGNFQLYQLKNEDKAIHHFIQGMKIDQESKEKEKMKNKLRKIACIRLSKNEGDAMALHLLAFLQELSGDIRPAEDNSESRLDSGSFPYSASFAEE
ncbi:interferon-induced protein with tetratricopeptide repeats 2 isoform X2 [Ailuropoda melanoleuca]|uniref:Interferon induced protein with tetratricopeptide repeats 2 n=1 Tax=Ailuropoda melanoleuca TaxID=9646 RepID=A0A7N5JEW5_AILME|nr:interferon-induced protein with tetratricopeptide repeats 2 isoform X2 [Ailuropoda melanoleuca]